MGSADELAKEACEIWKYPDLPADVVDKYRPSRGESDEAPVWTLQENHTTFAEGGLNQKLSMRCAESVLSGNPSGESYIAGYYVGFRSAREKLHAVLEGRTSKKKKKKKKNFWWLDCRWLGKECDDLTDPEDMCQTNVHRVDLARAYQPMLPFGVPMTFPRCSIL